MEVCLIALKDFNANLTRKFAC